MDLTAEDTPILAEVFQVAKELVAELGLEAKGYWLIVNGGANQKLGQLHFHLISER